jgi:glycosyltransferase 2 family protein
MTRLKVLARVAVSGALLVVLVWILDGDALLARLSQLRPVWVLVALAISLPQMALLAFRWRLTAARLGLSLSYGAALSEYYLGVFLNQLVPGGVMGDLSRAWRHGRAAPAGPAQPSAAPPSGSKLGPAVRAVILERASGQVVTVVVAALSFFALPLAAGIRARTLLVMLGGIAAIGVAALMLRRLPVAETIGRDVRAALLARDVVVAQVVTSALVMGSYVAVYLAAARAVGVATPFVVLAPLVAPVLLSMLIPVTIAGWGLREATAAALWSAVGLTAEDGVAISAAYGLLVLASALPGGIVLISAGRGRRADPRPDGSDGSAGGARGPGSPPAAG